ncbi:MAG: permease-like cell division protein FtsX [Lachnospiraceae bacterium]|nr:permease-like cell division protein FtsX [Lachnospiraceae bacterium]
MSFRAFRYSLKQGFINIRRNKIFTLASIGTMVACLFMLGVFLTILINFNHIVSSAESTITISVYFNKDATAEQIAEIGKNIKARDEVDTVEYRTAEQAWQMFSDEYYSGNEDLISSFGDDNPLGDSDSYLVTLKDIDNQEEFSAYLKNITGVRAVNSPEATMKSLSRLNQIISVTSISLIVILFLVSIFLISNTIVVAISVRREEIAIMRYIGAGNSYIRGPFVVEGVTIGLIGALIPIGLLYGLYVLFTKYVSEDLSGMASWLKLMPVNDVFLYLAPICIVLGIGIGLIGSVSTVRKHLKL